MQSEKIIIEKLLAGSEEAFHLLFNIYYKRLVSYSYTYVLDTQIAEDIVQDFFVMFWQKKQFKHISNLESYMFFAIRNNSLNCIRDNVTRQKRLDIILDDNEKYQIDYIHKDEEYDLQGVYNAINKLPSIRRKIFIMCYFKGLKYSQVAEHLDISINTVKVQMGRALRFIRENSFFFCNTLFLFLCL